MPVRLFGHAIHPMLVVFPLGLLTTSVLFDLLWYATDRESFATTAGHLAVAGLLSGPATALFGLLDWRSVRRGTRARRLGVVHGWGNVTVLVLFTASVLLRLDGQSWEPEPAAFVLSVLGVAIGGITGWMGGELIERLGVSVHQGAHRDAPSSLRSPPVASAARRSATEIEPGLDRSDRPPAEGGRSEVDA